MLHLKCTVKWFGCFCVFFKMKPKMGFQIRVWVFLVVFCVVFFFFAKFSVLARRNSWVGGKAYHPALQENHVETSLVIQIEYQLPNYCWGFQYTSVLRRISGKNMQEEKAASMVPSSTRGEALGIKVGVWDGCVLRNVRERENSKESECFTALQMWQIGLG